MKFLTTKEVAARLGVRTYTVSTWCFNGEFPGAFQLGRRSGWRIPEKALDKFIRSRSQEVLKP